MIDGKPGRPTLYPPFTSPRSLELIVSPDQTRYAYVAFEPFQDHKCSQVILGGVDGPKFNGKTSRISGLQFSTDSQHFLYMATTTAPGSTTATKYLVMDGKQEAFDGDFVLFSPDLRRSLVCRGSQVFGDGKPKASPGEDFQFLEARFSADSRHLAYVGRNSAHRYVIVLDGRKSPEFVDIFVDAEWDSDQSHPERKEPVKKLPPFSPDGKLRYLAQQGNAICYVTQE